MNEYIQEKDIKSLAVIYGTCDLQDINKIKKLEKEAYKIGVEDSLSKIPADRLTRELQTVGCNECRQQTIDNINKLLTNK